MQRKFRVVPHPTSTDGRNGWSYTAISPYAFIIHCLIQRRKVMVHIIIIIIIIIQLDLIYLTACQKLQLRNIFGRDAIPLCIIKFV